jgi:predicted AlkP superfamily phosphohydrolase/phosphomutase
MRKKLLVLGLDCAEPTLVFDRWLDDLPNIKYLKNKGISGRLKSIIPPITCPAWMSMLTGKQPGELGFYGFRNRADYSYDNLVLANSTMVQAKTVWDRLGEIGKKSILIGIPQTYPIREINGWQISGFLTPDINSKYTYPQELKEEIEDLVGDYKFDVDNFRSENKDYILDQIYEMTEKRFKIANYLMESKDWDFMMMVEIGLDRIQHAFWHYFDKEHINYPGQNEYQLAIKDYYIYLDRKIGELLEQIDEETAVMLVSDHGAKPMVGGICINEWLIKEGYLKLKEIPQKATSISQLEIDWENTIAWGYGGYYGRLYLNVNGREEMGVVEKGNYESVRDELINKLEALTDEKGSNIGTRVYKPEELYGTCNNIPPDLIVLFGDLYWRSIGSVGHNRIRVYENDTGPDGANHAQHGICIFTSNETGKQVKDNLNLLDITPTILDYFGLKVDEDWKGNNNLLNK